MSSWAPQGVRSPFPNGIVPTVVRGERTGHQDVYSINDHSCGLLDGIPSNGATYSMNMDLGRAAEMVSHRGIIYRAALHDVEGTNQTVAEYLGSIHGKVGQPQELA